jgi:hypothetical protein
LDYCKNAENRKSYDNLIIGFYNMMNVYTSFLFIALIVVSYSAISEVSLGNFDGSLHFVQVYEDGCSGCKTE